MKKLSLFNSGAEVSRQISIHVQTHARTQRARGLLTPGSTFKGMSLIKGHKGSVVALKQLNVMQNDIRVVGTVKVPPRGFRSACERSESPCMDNHYYGYWAWLRSKNTCLSFAGTHMFFYNHLRNRYRLLVETPYGKKGTRWQDQKRFTLSLYPISITIASTFMSPNVTAD